MPVYSAQSETSDSLKKLLKNFPESKRNNPEDTTEIQLLSQLAENAADDKEAQYYWLLLKNVTEKKIQALPPAHHLQKTFKSQLSYAYNDLGLIYRERGDVVKALEYLHLSLKNGRRDW